MSSFALFIIWVSILFFSAGFAQEMNSIQDFDPIDDQSQDPGGFQNLLSSEGAEVSDLPESTFIDTSVSDFEDSSVFTDTDLSDFHDAAFSSSILDASCANDDGIKPGKLRARGLSCVNQPDTAETLDLSKPSSSWKGDAVGVMTSDSYWCIDLQFALYHTVAVCDQLHPGALQISSRHYAVYPSSLIRPFDIFACPKERVYCCAEWLPNSVMTSVEISARLEYPGDDIGAGFDCVSRL